MNPIIDSHTFTQKSDLLSKRLEMVVVGLVVLTAFAVRILCGKPDDSDIFLAQQFDYTLVHSLILYESNC